MSARHKINATFFATWKEVTMIGKSNMFLDVCPQNINATFLQRGKKVTFVISKSNKIIISISPCQSAPTILGLVCFMFQAQSVCDHEKKIRFDAIICVHVISRIIFILESYNLKPNMHQQSFRWRSKQCEQAFFFYGLTSCDLSNCHFVQS